MAQAGMISSFVAGDLKAIGTMNEAQAEASALEYNAGQSESMATLEDIKAKDDARRLRVSAGKRIGEMRANLGATGVALDGSALDVLGESAANAELDAQNVQYAGEMKAGQLRNSAAIDTFHAKNARIAGWMKAYGQHVEGFGKGMSGGMGGGGGGGGGG